MTTIQIVSDLHIEQYEDVPNPLDFITPSADILILAGDIGSFYRIQQLIDFLKALCSYFKIVLYVPGNHEWYTMNDNESLSFDSLEKRMLTIENKIKNFYILNRSSVMVADICIAGCTLWSKPQCEIPKYIVRINDMKTSDYENLHNLDLEYVKNIRDYCKKKGIKMIVVSHHPPTFKALEGVKKRSKFLSLYATNLDYMLNKKDIDVWICGHIHANFDFLSAGGSRIVGNQKGKIKENVQNFKKDFTITI